MALWHGWTSFSDFMVQRNGLSGVEKEVNCDRNKIIYDMGLQATVLREIFLSAGSFGAAYDELCRHLNISPETLSDSKMHIEWQKSAGIWDLLADMFHAEDIGLTLAAEAKISMNGIIGFLMQCSRTLEAAVEVYCNYGYMVCPMVSFSYCRQGNEAVIEMSQNKMWQSAYPRNAIMAMDFTLGCNLYFSQQLAGKVVYPKRLYLEGPRRYKDAYTQLFKCPVSFNAEVYRMVYEVRDMDIPILSHEGSLYDMFNTILAKEKAAHMQESTGNALRQVLMMQFKGRIPTIEEAAEAMEMTVRTLQRNLKREGCSFREIGATVRKELALHLMRNCTSNVTQIAGIMGYADLPSFRRAFKSWTHDTPKLRWLKEQQTK